MSHHRLTGSSLSRSPAVVLAPTAWVRGTPLVLAHMITYLLLFTAAGSSVGSMITGIDFNTLSWLALVAGAGGLAMMVSEPDRPRIRAGRDQDAQGQARAYTLNYGTETITLEPGKPWHKLDTFKWITRGLIEEPQSLQVLKNGAVEINAERILLDDPDGPAKLELEINKHHPPSIAHHPPAISSVTFASESASTGKVRFKVKLDHLGHLMIECIRGSEHVETGLRGMPGLAQGGFMLPPHALHVDPLQRAVEIDGVRYDCTEAGACQLQEILNTRYAPQLQPEDRHPILIRENAASATGFDIEFIAIHAGGRIEVKGHLSQERLNLLQDHTRCDLLRHGIILRLSPPYLLVRRRQPDGGEERIPEIQDVHYLRVTAADLQAVLNHKVVRRTEAAHDSFPAASTTATGAPPRIRELRLVRNRQSRMFLWLECHYTQGKPSDGRAFTHHNVADLQQRGAFAHRFDISLSLDHRRLSILNQDTRSEQVVIVDNQSSDDELSHAGQLLTAALSLDPKPRPILQVPLVPTPIHLHPPQPQAPPPI